MDINRQFSKNLYFPGEKIFLYAGFEYGLNFVSPRQTEQDLHASTDNSKYGIYINGEYVSYEDYIKYYSEYINNDYFIPNTWETSYYAYNTYTYNPYYSNTIGFNNLFNVNAFEALDDDSIPILIEVKSQSMQCRILHDEDGEIFEDLPWTDMKKFNTSEFYYTFCIPYDFIPSQYQIIYKSIYDVSYYDKEGHKYNDNELSNLNIDKKNEHKVAHSMESFYIASKVDGYEDVVKVFGTVMYKRSPIFAEDVRVTIVDDNENKVYQSLTDREGHWEAYLYPGQYQFSFSRLGYITENIHAEIDDQSTQIPFENVTIGKGEITNGNGIYKVADTYLMKTGQPIPGLNVKAYNIDNPETLVAETNTNDKGVWELFLDDGSYILKVNGTFMNAAFNRIFRLRVNQDGEYSFDNISKNILSNSNSNPISNGTGSIKVTDTLADRFNNPISEVQVSVFHKDAELNDDNIIAQDYSDGNGNITLFLDPGEYIFEFFHPNYTTYTEERTVEA